MKQEAYPGTQAVLRAMRVLKAVADHGRESRLSDLAREVGLNKTTVFRLLSALESAEMVERTPSGHTYRLGPELVRLSSQALDKSGLQAAARPTLRALAAETRETITLEVLVGDEVLILDEATGGHVIGAMPSLGTRWPAHATSTGKVLLAGLSNAELETRLSGRLAPCTPRTITDSAALRREIERVRVNGYATAAEELEVGFVAVSAPIRSVSGEVVAAIGVGGPKSRLSSGTIGEIAGKLPAAADAVSESLGWRAPGRKRQVHVTRRR
jgi:IclR family transcriptional regulator, acetate operon repressor